MRYETTLSFAILQGRARLLGRLLSMVGNRPRKSRERSGEPVADQRTQRSVKMLPLPRDIKPDVERGQNFLLNAVILDREIEYAHVGREDVVLEIGPGIGYLTERLCDAARHVHAIEIDPQFRPLLTALAKSKGNLTLHWGNALDLDWPVFTKVVTNLPYQLALPIIFRLLETDFEQGVVIIQESMARKLAARPGKPGYGRVSILAAQAAKFQVLEVVNRHNFQPPSQVESAMLRLKKIRPRYQVEDPFHFHRILDLAFLQRTQPVAVALGELLVDRGVEKALARCRGGLAGKKVESLSAEEWATVVRVFWEHEVDASAVSDREKQIAQKLRPPGKHIGPKRSGSRPRQHERSNTKSRKPKRKLPTKRQGRPGRRGRRS